MADRIAVMDAGRLAQVGRPDELYRRPATRFVADFLGEANFIGGRVVAAGPPAEIETPVGVLRTTAPNCPAPPAAVTCCIRPERISMSPGEGRLPASSSSALPATIESSTYLGDSRQYTCRLAAAESWRVSAGDEGAAGPLPEGRRVTLSVAGDDVAILAD